MRGLLVYNPNATTTNAAVCLTPGDYVYADASGAVVIPAGSLKRVLDEAHRIEAEDTQAAAQIANEDPAVVVRGDT